MYLVSPSNEIRKIYFKNDLVPSSSSPSNGPNSNMKGVIAAGEALTLSLKYTDQGTNLIEINQDSGLAIVNQAVYVGDVYPLLPDYNDLKIQSLIDKTSTVKVLEEYMHINYPRSAAIKEPAKSASITEKRSYLLDLLNILRTREIIDPVYIDSKLTEIAQAHSNDMRNQGYFSHTNLAGEGPG